MESGMTPEEREQLIEETIYDNPPDNDADYWEEIDSAAYREGHKTYECRPNPYEKGTKEREDWNKGFYNAYQGYGDYLSGAGDW